MQGQPENAENCMVCCKSSQANRTLDPCGHSPACEECSAKMTHCLSCDALIERLEKKPESTNCLVCCKASKDNNCVLNPCGHRPACEECSAKMTHCLICDKAIERREHTTESEDCAVCCRPSKSNSVLDPCGHSPACRECAAKMTHCPTCDTFIGLRKNDTKSANCMVCCKHSKANRVLDPCGHSPACEECSAKMTHCLICDASIERCLTTDENEGLECVRSTEGKIAGI